MSAEQIVIDIGIILRNTGLNILILMMGIKVLILLSQKIRRYLSISTKSSWKEPSLSASKESDEIPERADL